MQVHADLARKIALLHTNIHTHLRAIAHTGVSFVYRQATLTLTDGSDQAILNRWEWPSNTEQVGVARDNAMFTKHCTR